MASGPARSSSRSLFAIGLFFVVPGRADQPDQDQLGSSVLFWLVEGVLRTAIFLGYLVLLSRLRDLRRVFEYHGAEHKVISCYEAETSSTPERGRSCTRGCTRAAGPASC